ncbi:MAG: M23 family metallopeptidase [Robiginitomaculum sp.]|nr:M23 family metallopeptidase [Robiginitomaculum sp.]
MKLFGQKWPRLLKTLSNDAAIYSRNVDGQSFSVKKPLIIVSTIAVISAFSVLGMAKYPSSAHQIQPQETIEAAPILSASMLYDLRTDVEFTPDTAQQLTLKSGQALGPLLQKNGVDASTTYQIVQAFASVYKPRNLRAGQKINLFKDSVSGAVTGFTLKPNSESTIFVSKSGDNNFKSRQVFAEYDKQIVRVKSQIQNSLYLDAQALGAPDKVIVQFSQIYAHSVDFQRDIRVGDSFEMLYEVYRDHRGQTVKAGDLIYTSFAPRGKTSEYYLYTKSNGREGYYDQKGKGAKRMLMRTPISGARLSSRFGKRKHPILGYVKSHSGVDFAARRGTPIMAAGNGTIKRAGRYGGYGNYVSISHSDGYATAYAHMSKFARGIRRGVRVRQGQTIGYVGTTGLSTGPHLHYEVHRKGKKINPMSLATLSGKPLQKQEIPAFKTRIREINALRAQVEKTSATKPEPELSVDLNSQEK